MARKGDNDYFGMMKETAACGHDAALRLKGILEAYTPDTLGESLTEMHAIEHHGDEMKHALVAKLVREFITPIEREDIMQIIDQIDDVIDAVEDILLNIYMYNIKAIRPEAIEFAEIICQCTAELVNAFGEFADFKKSKRIQASIIEINRLEELGDSLYIRAVRALYDGKTDAIEATTWTEVYGCFEKCCDTCEHTADLIGNVIMKNT